MMITAIFLKKQEFSFHGDLTKEFSVIDNNGNLSQLLHCFNV